MATAGERCANGAGSPSATMPGSYFVQVRNGMSAVLAKKLKRAHDHLQQGDAERARALCEEVLRDAPRNPDALYLLGLAQLAQGRPQDALAPLKRVLAADPQSLPALEYLG